MLLHRLERERVVEQVDVVHQGDLLQPLARQVVPPGEPVDHERVARLRAQVERLDHDPLDRQLGRSPRQRIGPIRPDRSSNARGQSSSVPSRSPIRCEGIGGYSRASASRTKVCRSGSSRGSIVCGIGLSRQSDVRAGRRERVARLAAEVERDHRVERPVRDQHREALETGERRASKPSTRGRKPDIAIIPAGRGRPAPERHRPAHHRALREAAEDDAVERYRKLLEQRCEQRHGAVERLGIGCGDAAEPVPVAPPGGSERGLRCDSRAAAAPGRARRAAGRGRARPRRARGAGRGRLPARRPAGASVP